eukprot:321604-Pleurochrysis_carterae.AAC.1
MVSTVRRVILPIALEKAAKHRTSEQPALKQPPLPKNPVVYDFALDELLARLVEHCSKARESIYETVVSWSAKPPTSSDPMRIIADVTDGRVFTDHPLL